MNNIENIDKFFVCFEDEHYTPQFLGYYYTELTEKLYYNLNDLLNTNFPERLKHKFQTLKLGTNLKIRSGKRSNLFLKRISFEETLLLDNILYNYNKIDSLREEYQKLKHETNDIIIKLNLKNK